MSQIARSVLRGVLRANRRAVSDVVENTLSLPTTDRVFYVPNRYDAVSGKFLDRDGKHNGTPQLLQYASLSAPVTLYHSSIVGTETATNQGTASVSFAAGSVTIGAGTAWHIVDSVGRVWEFCSALSSTSVVMWDVSGAGVHLVAGGLDAGVVAALCSSGREYGSNHLNVYGWDDAEEGLSFLYDDYFGSIPEHTLIPSLIYSSTYSVSHTCDIPRMLIVGTSIGEASCSVFYGPSPRTFTSQIILEGASTIPLVSGGVAAIGVVAGDYIVFQLHGGGAERKLISSISGDSISISTPTTRQIASGATVCKSSSTIRFSPLYQQTYHGYIRAVNSMLDNPFSICAPGISFGGMKADFILSFLDDAIKRYRPSVVWFNCFDNDVQYTSLESILSLGRDAVEKCMENGITPIVCPSLPSNFTADRVDVFDGIVDWCLNIGNEYPGAIGINPGAIYTITTDATYPRTFAPGWTDGTIHPTIASSYRIAKSVIDNVRSVMDNLSSPVDLICSNRYLTGSSGTNVANIQSENRAIPDGCLAWANVAHTVYITKTFDNLCKIKFLASSGVLGTYSWIKIPVNQTNVKGIHTFFSARTRLSIISHTGLSDIYISVFDGSGNIISQKLNYGLLDVDGILDGEDIVFDTAPCELWADSGNLTIGIYITPRTTSNVLTEFIIRECGIYYVNYGSAL